MDIEKVTSQVKCYKRKNSEQYLITLRQGNPFKPNEDVYIISKAEYDEFEDDNKTTLKYYQQLEMDNKKLENIKSELETLKNDYRIKDYDNLKSKYDIRETQETKLRNKLDHLQERLRVALEEINQQQKVISDLSNRSFFNYLTGKLPESYKQLSEPERIRKEDE